MIKSVITRNRQNNSVNLSGPVLTHPASSLFLSPLCSSDTERRKRGHNLGARPVRQRNRKTSRSASTVSPRTVKSVTTHNYQCHHAQQTEQTVRILLDPSYFTQPFISMPPSSPSDTQSIGKKELGDRLVKHRDWKRTKTYRSVITIGENPPEPILHHPVIHLYPLHLHQTHSLQEHERN
mgnify:CR=1 FL=1